MNQESLERLTALKHMIQQKEEVWAKPLDLSTEGKKEWGLNS